MLRPQSKVSSGFGSFFFQAEDGIRDLIVTGVQTCALPIYSEEVSRAAARALPRSLTICAESALIRTFNWPTTADIRPCLRTSRRSRARHRAADRKSVV